MGEDKKVILVVDDTPANIAILINILKSDYAVKVAKDGAKALQIAQSSATGIDLVLLDVLMPEMDGFEVCERLKQDATTRDIPVVFVTGRTTDEDLAKGKELGAAGYLTKPIEPETVMATVRSVLL
jgi:cyclic di-GMP phosphodiesterase